MTANVPEFIDNPGHDLMKDWHTPDRRRMADLTIALQRVAEEHGFLIEKRLNIENVDGRLPKLGLTFIQREQPEEMKKQIQVAEQIRQEFGVEWPPSPPAPRALRLLHLLGHDHAAHAGRLGLLHAPGAA